jgi:hypothetical protein
VILALHRAAGVRGDPTDGTIARTSRSKRLRGMPARGGARTGRIAAGVVDTPSGSPALPAVDRLHVHR